MAQNTSHLVMIRPVSFTFNEQTALNNAFQKSDSINDNASNMAVNEFNSFVKLLKDNGVEVMVFDDTEYPHTPDSVFLNNWFSTHESGDMVLYPMFAPNRRLERRPDIADAIAEDFQLTEIVDLTLYEQEERFLEGTGSMVLDRDLRICYACISPRTDKTLLQVFCNKMGYELIAFHAVDKSNQPIYHTNVVMCVGDQFLVICFECIPNPTEIDFIRQSTGKEIIEISYNQLEHFAGNMLEVLNNSGEHLLVMSSQAYNSLTPLQITKLEKYARIIHTNLDTIETLGGGSARCMIAENFLPIK
ncbi:MAG: amidinotransferase [Bacteroidia bacterium]|nr:amidinotransferase [Bacteroidia bacterium]